jgi:hypothetical protein
MVPFVPRRKAHPEVDKVTTIGLLMMETQAGRPNRSLTRLTNQPKCETLWRNVVGVTTGRPEHDGEQ